MLTSAEYRMVKLTVTSLPVRGCFTSTSSNRAMKSIKALLCFRCRQTSRPKKWQLSGGGIQGRRHSLDLSLQDGLAFCVSSPCSRMVGSIDIKVIPVAQKHIKWHPDTNRYLLQLRCCISVLPPIVWRMMDIQTDTNTRQACS